MIAKSFEKIGYIAMLRCSCSLPRVQKYVCFNPILSVTGHVGQVQPFSSVITLLFPVAQNNSSVSPVPTYDGQLAQMHIFLFSAMAFIRSSSDIYIIFCISSSNLSNICILLCFVLLFIFNLKGFMLISYDFHNFNTR